jgi:hypothetical protein
MPAHRSPAERDEVGGGTNPRKTKTNQDINKGNYHIGVGEIGLLIIFQIFQRIW